MAVAVIVNPCASRAPCLARPGYARFLRDLGEHAILVVIQAVLPVVGDVEIFPSVVVVIADADPLAPARRSQTRFHSDISEGAVVIVAIEMIGGSFTRGKAFQGCSVHQKNVGPAVVIVVENGRAGASGFDDVLLRVLAAEHDGRRQASLLGNVGKVGDGVLRRFGWRLSRDHTAEERREDDEPCPRRKEYSKLRKPRQIHDPECILGSIAEAVKAGRTTWGCDRRATAT